MIASDAVLSDCGLYRYRLDRRWSAGHSLVFVMLNPSTADASVDDRTIRRCIGFSKREGMAGITVVNLCALRATKPADLAIGPSAIGSCNDRHIDAVLSESGAPVIAAWGANVKRWPWLRAQSDRIRARIGDRARCLRITGDGFPGHPLYVPGDAPLMPFPGMPE